MSTWTRHVCSTFLAGLAIALLAGCGGAPAAQLPSNVDVQLQSFSIQANTVKAKAGKVTFNVMNQAKDVQHEMLVIKTDLALDALPYDSSAGRLFEDKINSLGEVAELDGGKSGSVTLDLEPGQYLLLCNIATHFKSGMVIPLEVR